MKTKRKASTSRELNLWLQIGDGEPEEFGQDQSALADAIYGSYIDPVGISWHKTPQTRDMPAYVKRHKMGLVPPVGFRSPLGTEVAIYWGDDEGDTVIQPLTPTEQRSIHVRLLRLAAQDRQVFIIAPTFVGGKQHIVAMVDKDIDETALDAYTNEQYDEVEEFDNLKGAMEFAALLGCQKPEIV